MKTRDRLLAVFVKPTLADSLKIVLPALAPEIAAPEVRLELQKLAQRLVPIPRGGFECRLSANSPQVDLQQCIMAGENETTWLREHIAATTLATGMPAHPSWARIQEFLTQWANPSSLLHDSVPEIWLEFDSNAPPSVPIPLPAVFFALPQDVSRGSETYRVAEMALDLLLGKSGWSRWQENLRRCFEACPDGVFISHIGVMLSRSAKALRVNVRRLPPDLLVSYLQQVGWQGATDNLEALMTQLFAFVDRITICLDLGSRVYPKIGFECFLRQPQQEPRWATFLDYLVNRGWCTKQKRDALLNWPGQTNPTNALAPWPGHLIAASLLQPPNCFTEFDRRLSHIKIVTSSTHPPEAKGYLWFQHKWLPV